MKKLNVKKLPPQIVCHRDALPAYQFTQLIFCFRSKSAPNKYRIALFARIVKLNFSVRGGSECFFEGWMPLLFPAMNISADKCLITASNIEIRSWLYALHSILILSSKDKVIGNLALFFDHAPQHIQTRIFGFKLPRTVMARVIEFSGESRAAVRHVMNKGKQYD